MQHARSQGNTREVWDRGGQVRTGDIGLHNITDVIASIHYPVSATDTRYQPKGKADLG
jgi:hypothetical protein